jgi:hypothetical protein
MACGRRYSLSGWLLCIQTDCLNSPLAYYDLSIMLSPTQTFLRLLLLFVVLESALFAAMLWLFDMTTGQKVGLSVIGVVMLVVFAIRTWNNPELHR